VLCVILIYFLGWGRTVGGGSAADTLQQAMLPVAEHSACSRVNGRLVPVDESSMVCAGGQGKGGCQVLKGIQIIQLEIQHLHQRYCQAVPTA